ncbi:IS66 family transposase, partial [Thiolapillus sp.]|uniref:IS66 family transposase n=3 Tax=Thiolapillus sp. TaxID=2017437 RepID=UPI00263AAF53
ASSTPDTCQGLLIPSIWAYRSLSLIGDYDNLPTPFGEEPKNLQKRYRNILTRGAKQLPPIPLRQNGKRGRVAKSDAHNLWERLKKHEMAVLLFARLSHVPFTNNRAERDLRMSKVKQKVSGCFRTRKYAEAYCRISSYLQTMANQGYNPLVAIQMAFSGQLYADRGE